MDSHHAIFAGHMVAAPLAPTKIAMAFDVDVTARAPVYRTEVRERVVSAITNVFPEGTLAEVRDRDHLRYGEEVVVRAEDVEHLREQVDRQDVVPTVRNALLDGVEGDAVALRLSKQVALVGRVNVDVGGHELGAIDVRIRGAPPQRIVDRIAPPAAGEDDG